MTIDFKPLVLAVLRGNEAFAVDRPTNTMKAQSGFISFSSVNTRFPFSTTQSSISNHAQLRPRRKTLQRRVSSTKSECNVATAQHFLSSHGRIFQTLEFKWEVKAGRTPKRTGGHAPMVHPKHTSPLLAPRCLPPLFIYCHSMVSNVPQDIPFRKPHFSQACQYLKTDPSASCCHLFYGQVYPS